MKLTTTPPAFQQTSRLSAQTAMPLLLLLEVFLAQPTLAAKVLWKKSSCTTLQIQGNAISNSLKNKK